jgi:O-methyltransferase involved in polyketide biosynthesis
LLPESEGDSNPNKIHKVHLTGEKETLLITLYAKALDNRSKHPILHDEKADEIVKTIDYDFEKLKGFGNGNVMVVRAKQLDEWIKEFLKSNPNAVVMNLGCGLDTRISRINPPPTVSWFDVDFPEVIKERQNFFSNQDGYQMIASSVTELDWLEKTPKNRPAIMIADGVFEYLAEKEVKELLNRLTNYFPCGQAAFDIMNSYAIKMGKSRLQKTTGGEHKWAVDDINKVDELDSKLRRISNLAILQSKYLPLRYRLLFGIACVSPRYRNMIRLLRYEF